MANKTTDWSFDEMFIAAWLLHKHIAAENENLLLLSLGISQLWTLAMRGPRV